jgi:pyrroloquinoline quinone biosynthesis protein E
MKEAAIANRKASGVPAVSPPMALLAEITHRCPLACPYCSNPIELTKSKHELSTEIWIDVFEQAADLGVLHLHLSGGEPAARRDLVELTKAAADIGLYTNLITSGIGLTEPRICALVNAGLDHLQLSMQATTPKMTKLISGYEGAFERKIATAKWARDAGLPLTINAVVHRLNLDSLPEMIDLSLYLGARRLEIANVQFHGWATRNVVALLPTKEQTAKAAAIVAAAQKKLAGRLVIDFVPSDYHAKYPKACMGGWGRIGLNITPDGKVLPCHAAETIPSLSFDNVHEKSLADIWYHSTSFNAFRGEEWMQEPCRRCERRHIDYGGCRCQAMALVHDPQATDPVCCHSPMRSHTIAEILDQTLGNAELFYRRFNP